MQEWLVGKQRDFDNQNRKIITVNGREIVVFSHKDRLYALENNCLHSGGPVGEGILIGKVEAVLTADKRFVGERFSEAETHIVCPWHGWEYNIETGECAGDRTRRLRTYEVVNRGEDVYVVA